MPYFSPGSVRRWGVCCQGWGLPPDGFAIRTPPPIPPCTDYISNPYTLVPVCHGTPEPLFSFRLLSSRPSCRGLHADIVECNTAYPGARTNDKDHMEAAREHGFTAIAPFHLLDSVASTSLPVAGSLHHPRARLCRTTRHGNPEIRPHHNRMTHL